MLRRKLLIVFGSLVILLVVMGVAAVWTLQGVLRGLDHINSDAASIVKDAGRLNLALSAIEIDLLQLQLGQERHLDTLISDVATAQHLIASIGSHYVVHEPGTSGVYLNLAEKFPQFTQQVSLLATVQDADLAREYNMRTARTAMELREGVRRIDSGAREHASLEQVELTERFRWLILGVALGYVIVVNVSILVLLRASRMVLAPVDTLLEASRHLTGERFDHRAELAGNDEFSELATAYNTLAERVQADEQRRMEMLGQVALTLNHELNNAIATIEMQLQLLSRRSTQDGRFATGLQNIQEGLGRMARTVESLKHIRRIVLTDYTAGVKMLDLQRSVSEHPDSEEVSSCQAQEVDQP